MGILASRDEPHPTTFFRRDRKRLLRRRSALEESLEGFTGPIVVIEYLENGDLARLYKRLVNRDQLLPNRVIWSFFLCCEYNAYIWEFRNGILIYTKY